MKNPIALLVNDLHVSKENIQQFQLNWMEAVDICLKNEIKAIVVGGDMFTERATQTLPVLMSVKNMLEHATRNEIGVVIAEGNHDKPDSNSETGYNHLWDGLKGVEAIGAFAILCFKQMQNAALAVISYFPPALFLEHLDNIVEEAKAIYPDIVESEKDIILYIHQGVHGALGDFEIEDEIPQEPLLPFKAVLCGHYHNRCKIKGTNIEYIGSSRQHNFGEDEEKGYTILYSDGSTEFVKNQANTRYRTYELDADELETFEMPQESDCKYRLKLKCTEQQLTNVDRQKLLEMGFNKVEIASTTPVDKEVAAQGITEKYDTTSIKKEYRVFCEQNEIDSELGLKYLED